MSLKSSSTRFICRIIVSVNTHEWLRNCSFVYAIEVKQQNWHWDWRFKIEMMNWWTFSGKISSYRMFYCFPFHFNSDVKLCSHCSLWGILNYENFFSNSQEFASIRENCKILCKFLFITISKWKTTGSKIYKKKNIFSCVYREDDEDVDWKSYNVDLETCWISKYRWPSADENFSDLLTKNNFGWEQSSPFPFQLEKIIIRNARGSIQIKQNKPNLLRCQQCSLVLFIKFSLEPTLDNQGEEFFSFSAIICLH